MAASNLQLPTSTCFFRFTLILLLWKQCRTHAVATVISNDSVKDISLLQSEIAEHTSLIAKLSAQVTVLQQNASNMLINNSALRKPVDQVPPNTLSPQVILKNTYVQRQRQLDTALEGSWTFQADPPLRFRPQVDDLNAEEWLTKNNCSESSSFPGQSYVWKPLNQPFRNYTRATFCRLMRGRHLILVGDSMNDEFFLTLYQMLWQGGMSIKEFYHKWGKGKDKTMFDNVAQMMKILVGVDEQNVPGFYIPCPEGGTSNSHFRLSFIRNYYLGLNRKDASDEVKWEYIKPFIPYIEKHRGAILVLNRGAHFRPDKEFVRGLTDTFGYLKKKHRDALVIYRDTPSGHLDTPLYQRSIPLSPSDAQRSRQKQISDPKYRKYKYDGFPAQNKLARQLIVGKFPEILFMSVADSTNLRWDSHTDPLHYCIPGPIDHWVQKLADVLLVADAYPDLLPQSMRGKISPS